MRPNPVGWGIALFFLILGAAFALFSSDSDGRILGLIFIGVAAFLLILYASMLRRANRADALRRSGIPGRAVIKSMVQTGTYVNQQPLVKLDFEVQPEGLPAYELKKRLVVPQIALGQLGIGNALPVHLDPNDRNEIAIDWGAPAAPTTEPGTQRSRDPSERLEELKRLRDDGAITAQDYESKKAEILSEI